jgi:sugar phosphate permease
MIFYGWWIVALSFLTMAFVSATVWYGFTTYFAPLIAAFGWSYTAISAAASLRGLETGLLDIGIGFLVDRFGSRRLILAGTVLISIGFLMLSRINSLALFYVSFITIFIGAAGVSPVVFYALVSQWFRKRIGLAIGLAAAGGGAGGFALPGIVYLLDLIGFRAMFILFSIVALIAGGITAYFVRSRPEDMSLGTDGTASSADKGAPKDVHAPATRIAALTKDSTVRAAMSSSAFWMLAYISAVMTFSVMMVSTHIMPYLEHTGYSRYVASIAAMMVPLVSTAGRLGIGWISDYVNHKTVLGLMVLGQCVSLFIFLYAQVPFILFLSVTIFSLSYGGIIVLRIGVLRDCYGTARIGALIGLCMGLSHLASIGGPVLAGWLFDTTDSYSLAWIAGSALLLVGVPLALIINYPQKAGSM